jgi:Ca2+-transporting ATPase
MVVVGALLLLGIYRGESLFDMLLIAAAVAVGAVPEALPIALTIILAIGMQRLAQKNGVMRSLSAAETLGSATVVLTDKTGTLTQAKLRMSAIYTLDELSGKTVQHKESTKLEPKDRTVLETALAGTGAIIDNPDAPLGEWTYSGHPVETGILHAAAVHGLDVLSFVTKRRAPLLAFNSTNKFSINAHHEKEFYVVLGAPDILLARSKLSKDAYVAAEESVHTLSGAGKRVLGVARFHHHPEKIHVGTAHEKDAHSLEFLGLLVFEDPLRPEAKEAVKKIESLGASVVMVTGDLKGTAISIARRLGWEVNDGHALSGEELRQISDDELLKNLRNIRIFARVTPEDKLRVAQLYRRLGEVVAMTGDGVNDAPSLRAVDIGIALGSGSDVAKSAADLVLLDDNFKTIVAAIEEGRRILDNIRKTAVYLLSTSLNEVILVGGALIAGLPLPLSALQIIWVNMFTESFPALAFAFDKSYDADSREKKGTHRIFNGEVKVLTIGLGTAISLCLFGLYWWLLAHNVALHDAQSTMFLCLAGYILIVAFSLRSLHRPLWSYRVFENHILNWSVLVALGLIIATVTVPFLQNIFSVSVPPPPLLAIVGAWLVLNVIIIELAKWWFRTSMRDS